MKRYKRFVLLTFGSPGLGQYEYEHRDTAEDHAKIIRAKSHEFVILDRGRP